MNEKIELSKCSIDDRGDVTCSIPKSKLDVMTEKKIKPSKMVFEIDDS